MNGAIGSAAMLVIGLTGVCARADLFAAGANHVYRYNSAGARVETVGGSEEFNSVTRGPDGNIYVVSNVLGLGNVFRIDPATGQAEGLLNPSPTGAAYTMPFGLAFGPDGALYAGSNQFDPSFGTTGVMKYNPATGAMEPFVELGGPNSLIRDLGFGPDANLYVAVGGAGIFKVDGDGDLLELVRTHSDEYPYVSGGSRMTFGPDGMLYLSDAQGNIHRNDIVANDYFGIFVGATSGGAHTVNGMTFGADGDFYVASGSTGSILRYDGQTGAFRGVFTSDPGEIRSQRWDIAQVPEPAQAAVAGLLLLAFGRRSTRQARLFTACSDRATRPARP